MSRRVLLSFVGTGNYIPCRYVLKGEKPSKVVTYVQEALADLFFKERKPEDAIIIFFTDKAYSKHGDGIKKSLDKYEIIKTVEGIPESFSEEDNWKLFTIIFNELQAEDEVILDITHAFRSIPTLASVLLSYAKAIKGIKVKGIFYGAFEKLGTAREVEIQYPILEERIAPLVDMSIYSTLQDWTYASATYIDTGNPAILKRLTDEYADPKLRESKGRNELAKKMKFLTQSLYSLDIELATVRAYDIEAGKSITNALLALNEIKNEKDTFITPISGLFKKIAYNLEYFSIVPNDRRWIRTVDWYIRNNKIQQGVTLLLEGLISEFCIHAGLNPQILEDRYIIGQSVAIYISHIPIEYWKEPAINNIEKVQIIIGNQNIISMTHVYSKLNNIRNDINHAGYRKNHIAAKSFQNELIKNYREVCNWLKKINSQNVP
jgi:CRISPR-associated Csx2 family protein